MEHMGSTESTLFWSAAGFLSWSSSSSLLARDPPLDVWSPSLFSPVGVWSTTGPNSSSLGSSAGTTDDLSSTVAISDEASLTTSATLCSGGGGTTSTSCSLLFSVSFSDCGFGRWSSHSPGILASSAVCSSASPSSKSSFKTEGIATTVDPTAGWGRTCSKGVWSTTGPKLFSSWFKSSTCELISDGLAATIKEGSPILDSGRSGTWSTTASSSLLLASSSSSGSSWSHPSPWADTPPCHVVSSISSSRFVLVAIPVTVELLSAERWDVPSILGVWSTTAPNIPPPILPSCVLSSLAWEETTEGSTATAMDAFVSTWRGDAREGTWSTKIFSGSCTGRGAAAGDAKSSRTWSSSSHPVPLTSSSSAMDRSPAALDIPPSVDAPNHVPEPSISLSSGRIALPAPFIIDVAIDIGVDRGAGVWSTIGPNLSVRAFPAVSSSASSTSESASNGSTRTIVEPSMGLLNLFLGIWSTRLFSSFVATVSFRICTSSAPAVRSSRSVPSSSQPDSSSCNKLSSKETLPRVAVLLSSTRFPWAIMDAPTEKPDVTRTNGVWSTMGPKSKTASSTIVSTWVISSSLSTRTRTEASSATFWFLSFGMWSTIWSSSMSFSSRSSSAPAELTLPPPPSAVVLSMSSSSFMSLSSPLTAVATDVVIDCVLAPLAPTPRIVTEGVWSTMGPKFDVLGPSSSVTLSSPRPRLEVIDASMEFAPPPLTAPPTTPRPPPRNNLSTGTWSTKCWVSSTTGSGRPERRLRLSNSNSKVLPHPDSSTPSSSSSSSSALIASSSRISFSTSKFSAWPTTVLPSPSTEACPENVFRAVAVSSSPPGVGGIWSTMGPYNSSKMSSTPTSDSPKSPSSDETLKTSTDVIDLRDDGRGCRTSLSSFSATDTPGVWSTNGSKSPSSSLLLLLSLVCDPLSLLWLLLLLAVGVVADPNGISDDIARSTECDRRAPHPDSIVRGVVLSSADVLSAAAAGTTTPNDAFNLRNVSALSMSISFS